MVMIAAAVGGYILAHENLKLPSWVPVLGRNYYTLEAEFQTAQAVTPGQGQAVTIAGAKIGEIATVDLHNGVARRDDAGDPQVRSTSTATRRCCCARRRSCRTSPSRSTRARRRPANCRAARCSRCRRPRRTSTSTNSSPASTLKRAPTCRSCSPALGEGLKDNGRTLAAALKRFDPTARYGEEIAKASRSAPREHRALDPQLPPADGSARRQGQAARRSSSTPPTPCSGRSPRRTRTSRRRSSCCRARCTRPASASASSPPPRNVLGPDAAQAAAVRARARTGQRSDAQAGADDDADHQERDPPVRARNPARRQRTRAVDQAARRSVPEARRRASRCSTNSSTSSPTTPGPSKGGFLFFLDWGNHDLNSVVSTSDANGAARAQPRVLQLRNPADPQGGRGSQPNGQAAGRPAEASDAKRNASEPWHPHQRERSATSAKLQACARQAQGAQSSCPSRRLASNTPFGGKELRCRSARPRSATCS